MVHKINTDRLYEMHGTPGGTIRDPELKIPYGSSSALRREASQQTPPKANQFNIIQHSILNIEY